MSKGKRNSTEESTSLEEEGCELTNDIALDCNHATTVPHADEELREYACNHSTDECSDCNHDTDAEWGDGARDRKRVQDRARKLERVEDRSSDQERVTDGSGSRTGDGVEAESVSRNLQWTEP